jgi:shikimate kinase
VRLSGAQFREWPTKSITLLGMSGVGKTRLANLLREKHWFHFSGDYRIGTRYMGEAILDNLKSQVMQIPFLRELMRSDSIHITNNITVDNLKTVSSFLGKLGNPEQGGLGLKEFKRRQELHRQAELSSMLEVPDFIQKARNIYGYQNFINDAGGSLCELDSPEVMHVLAEHTLIIYIRASEHDEHELIKRAERSPKPLYYREEFLDQQLAEYMTERKLEYCALIDPDDFVRWIFPRLFYARIPRYQAIAAEHGYTITTEELSKVSDEEGFLELITSVLDRQPA